MERFAHFARKRVADSAPGQSVHDLSALAEALASGGDPAAVALELGTGAAARGAPWAELLGEVESVCSTVTGAEPSYEVVRALSTAWAEASLQHVHEMSCEDPLTGLATLVHMRTRLDEVYRVAGKDGRHVDEFAALIVVELPRLAHGAARLLGSLAMLEVAESMRAVFDGAETVARAGEHRAIALVDRQTGLLSALTALRLLLHERIGGSEAPSIRMWVEGLPRSSQGASRLLDELAH